jgi:hypothetical protein
MAAYWNTGRNRGPNVVDPQPQRMDSVDGGRRALGRNVKRSLPEKRYDSVQVWTLKGRDAAGAWVVVRRGVSVEAAEEWVGRRWNPATDSSK